VNRIALWTSIGAVSGLLALAGCGDDDATADAASDGGGGDQAPGACAVGAPPAQSRILRFRVRNRGWSTIYTRVANSCSMEMKFSSCAAGYQDQLVVDYNVCPCDGTCPVGGPGCPPDGRPLAAGANEDRDIDTLVPMLTSRNGQECSTGNRILPPGRYRWAVSVYASAAEAAAGSGGRLYQQEFELLAGLGAQVVEVDVSLDAPDGGADAGADAAEHD
jgi:hypothetical protein